MGERSLLHSLLQKFFMGFSFLGLLALGLAETEVVELNQKAEVVTAQPLTPSQNSTPSCDQEFKNCGPT